jgi:hypothetical protein
VVESLELTGTSGDHSKSIPRPAFQSGAGVLASLVRCRNARFARECVVGPGGAAQVNVANDLRVKQALMAPLSAKEFLGSCPNVCPWCEAAADRRHAIWQLSQGEPGIPAESGPIVVSAIRVVVSRCGCAKPLMATHSITSSASSVSGTSSPSKLAACVGMFGTTHLTIECAVKGSTAHRSND